MCRCAEIMDRNISDVESKPLWMLKSSTIENEIGTMLDVKKCLPTEGDWLFRDWRGLQDIANEGREASNRIEIDPNSSKSKTLQIVQQWCRKENVTIKTLLKALKKMERMDVVKSAIPNILADCKNVGTVDAEDLKLLTTTRTIWTTQDLRAERENPNADLKKYDGVVLYDMTDAAFAHHFISRMREIGYDMFDINLDLPIGMLENAEQTDIISKRCKTVMLICSEAYFEKKEPLFLTEIARMKSIKVFPIIYDTQSRIKNMPYSIDIFVKAVYDPKRYNFWEKMELSLEESLGTKKVLTPATKAMNFRPEQEEEDEPGSSSQRGVVSGDQLLSTPPDHDPNSSKGPFKKLKKVFQKALPC